MWTAKYWTSRQLRTELRSILGFTVLVSVFLEFVSFFLSLVLPRSHSLAKNIDKYTHTAKSFYFGDLSTYDKCMNVIQVSAICKKIKDKK